MSKKFELFSAYMWKINQKFKEASIVNRILCWAFGTDRNLTQSLMLVKMYEDMKISDMK